MYHRILIIHISCRRMYGRIRSQRYIIPGASCVRRSAGLSLLFSCRDVRAFRGVGKYLDSVRGVGWAMEQQLGRPHAVLFPYPAQGHIKPFMDLAKILCGRGFSITFVTTEFTHERIVESSGSAPAPFRFETVPDGLPPEHGRTLNVPELSESLTRSAPPHFEKLMHKLMPVSCIVSDSILCFTQNVANELGIPRIAFWTGGACGFSAYYFGPLLIRRGYVPLADERCYTNGYLEEVITCVPGMPPLRVKDLPSFFVVTPACKDFMFEYLMDEAQRAPEADLLILNTFEELEKPVMDALRTKFPVYSVGPLLLAAEEEKEGFGSSLWAEETSCLDWLDGHRPESVLYVSFGSITVMSQEQLVEFAWGLEGSHRPFLWVIRPDLIRGPSGGLPGDFLEKTKGRSLYVKWAPQMKILSHPSVGGFLTHSGWNSILESICAGVPMICWPFFSEQQINRRFVNHVWQIGLEMNDVVERGEVERLVCALMNGAEGKEMRRRVRILKEAANRAIDRGGSSCIYLEKLLEKMMMGTPPPPPQLKGLGGDLGLIDPVAPFC